MDMREAYEEVGFVPAPELAADLYRSVRYAAAYLAFPLQMQGTSIKCPEVGLGQYSFFLEKPYLIALNPQSFMLSFQYDLPHEVTHLLHSKLNPRGFRVRDIEGRNLSESVAHYGAKIFTRDTHENLDIIRRNILRGMMSSKSLRKLGPVKPQSRMDRINNYETHQGGHMLAEFLLAKTGEEAFPRLARTDVNEAKDLMKYYGYKGSLFVKSPMARS